MRWTPFRPLQPNLSLTPPVLAETLDGGQAFRWQLVAGERDQKSAVWQGIVGSHLVRLTEINGQLGFCSPEELPTPESQIASYLALDQDFSAIADSLPWRSDPRLRAALEALPGLRILRQPFGETLLGFLASSNKQIVQIKQILEALATRLGEVIRPGFHALPKWERLSEVPVEELLTCHLGYRAKYVAGTAAFLARHPGWLAETENAPHDIAKARLLQLPGVGPKVADCILLFGAGRLEAFPVDTWVQKAMARLYGLDGWNLKQIAHFGRIHFGDSCGYAQQVLFAAERARTRTTSPAE